MRFNFIHNYFNNSDPTIPFPSPQKFDVYVGSFGNNSVLVDGNLVTQMQKNTFRFFDSMGGSHFLTIKTGALRPKCFIDGVEYNYFGKTAWYEYLLVFFPLAFSWWFMGYLFTIPCALVNLLIVTKTNNIILKILLCVLCFGAFYVLNIFAAAILIALGIVKAP